MGNAKVKSCGTCRHFRQTDRRNGVCEALLPTGVPAWAWPKSPDDRAVTVATGKDCEVWDLSEGKMSLTDRLRALIDDAELDFAGAGNVSDGTLAEQAWRTRASALYEALVNLRGEFIALMSDDALEPSDVQDFANKIASPLQWWNGGES